MTTAATAARRLDVIASLALGALTMATGLGLGRLVVDTSLLGPVALVAAAAHGTAFAIRRLGGATALGLVGPVAVGIATITVVQYGAESTFGLPNGAVLGALGDDLSVAWQVFRMDGAPAPVVDGFVVAAMAAVIVTATTSDLFAFRLRLPIEAVCPATGLFVFTTVLAGADHRILASGAYLASLFGFVLAHRIAMRARGAHWFAAPRGRGSTAWMQAGALMGLGCILAGLVLGPALPGADADPLIDLDPTGSGARVTISPLVDIQTRLVEQSARELFTVRTTERSYWRLTTLDHFDGQIWSSSGSYVEAEGPLPDAADTPGGSGRTIEQAIDVKALGGVWLPAAPRPTAFTGAESTASWNAETGALITEGELSEGFRYEVTSQRPIVEGAAAAAADPTVAPGDGRGRFSDLPESFSSSARQVADDIVAAATTPYSRALALQDWFREEFRYSLDVPPGHGSDDIDEFLANRIGYCEQFSGAYAAMARSVGLASRVAVGFTPGETDPSDPSLFRVRGEHAHAWPEVHLGSLGWVAFEPTPGRGAPGAEAYTGVPEQQEGQPGPTPVTTPTTALVPGGSAPATVPSASPPGDEASAVPGPAGAGTRNWLRPALALVALAAALGTVTPPALVAAGRRRRRRLAAGHPADEILVAWADTTRSLRLAGLRRQPAETPVAFASRAGRVLVHDPTGRRALDTLATAITAVWFGRPTSVDAGVAAAARAAAERIDLDARAVSTRRQRFGRSRPGRDR